MIDPRFFKKSNPLSLEQICQHLDVVVPDGFDKDRIFESVAVLGDADSKDVSCYNNAKYLEDLKQTKAGLCLITAKEASNVPSSTLCLVVDHPYRCFGKIASLFYPSFANHQGISDHSFIDPTAKVGRHCVVSAFAVIEADVIVGDNCFIGPHCVIQKGTILGDNCHLEAHVTVGCAILGNHVYIKPGARIGQPGFGFHMDEKGHFDIPQLGRVIVGNHVHIGANTTIDRGSFADTLIGNGVRIDNLVQIAHNVEVGDNSVLVAQVGIAGSTKLGKFVIAAGQVGIAGHLKIGHGVKIAAQSGLMRDVADKETVAGSPAVPVRDWHKQTIAVQRLIKNKV
ncbi:UDP-3-O-(3-hydroxymyristoyl)glucosamine N-acyltransferase [Candidatus Finniella inopinata]|uniref:UDP-3-O-acylglucosamine N-acyltransferase n=1 Tax=Candidatus Finniella inopinata TaxID=1696036 RepID=A0A4V2DZP2_9PROT|nr:UDP-3-O-(3-hydroxymyristoyl)glucosamine N-acyltransferase [Candidatus Finniella inopinata]RZI45747.1 UDP-3-O-(3-hydroxymyristoyl)glucosamine N-acyltransferase [Candidatus Finniella inopinata]